MKAFIVIFIIVGIIYLLRYFLRRDPTWIFRTLLKQRIKKMQREQEKARTRREKAAQKAEQQAHHSNSRIIPPEYGEDVEYEEIKEYSHTSATVITPDGESEYSESQISDAEWIEIK